MSRFSAVLFSAVLWMAGFAIPLPAQYLKPPQAYSATVVNAMFGPAVTMKIDRDGSRAVIENTYEPGAPGTHTQSYYNLETHQNFTLDKSNPTPACSQGKFSGDWGDPFEQSVSLMADVLKQNPQTTGAETVNGFATKVMEAGAGAQKIKLWLDTKYGLIVKAQLGGHTLIELKQLSLTKPAAPLLVLPAVCAALPPPPLSKVEQFAKHTSTSAADYTDPTTMAASSPNSCTVVVRMLHTGTLQPIASGFRMALDTTADLDNPAHYVTGGTTLFSGGGVREVTGQMRNGELRIDNAPPVLYLEAWFEHGGPSGFFRRSCVAPQTVLLLVMNPENLTDPVYWLWVKSGKFATGTHR